MWCPSHCCPSLLPVNWEAYLGVKENGKAYAIYFKTFTYVGAMLKVPNTNYYNDVLHMHQHHQQSVSDTVNSSQLAIDCQ